MQNYPCRNPAPLVIARLTEEVATPRAPAISAVARPNSSMARNAITALASLTTLRRLPELSLTALMEPLMCGFFMEPAKVVHFRIWRWVDYPAFLALLGAVFFIPCTRGALHFMATEKNFTAEVFCEFLRRLIDNATHPVYLIVDRHSVHRSAEVQKFVASTEGKRVSRFRPRSPFFIPTPFPACKAVFKSSDLSPSAPLTLRKRQPPF